MSRDYHTRLPADHADGVDQYAEDQDINKSEVLRRAVARFLEDEGYPREKELVPDGGRVTTDSHPWVVPLINFSYYASLGSILTLLLGMITVGTAGGAVKWFGADLTPETAALILSFSFIMMLWATVLLSTSILALAVLEYLMPAHEAPIRRYFPQTWAVDPVVVR